MRAVNLLPSDLRGAAPKPAPSVRQEKAEGFGAYVVLGVLALCVAAFAGYVLTTNTVKQREADLQAAQDRATAAATKAAALKPYADFEAMATARITTVRGLAAPLPLLNSGDDLTLAHPAGAGNAHFLRDSLQIGQQHAGQPGTAMATSAPVHWRCPPLCPGIRCSAVGSRTKRSYPANPFLTARVY